MPQGVLHRVFLPLIVVYLSVISTDLMQTHSGPLPQILMWTFILYKKSYWRARDYYYSLACPHAINLTGRALLAYLPAGTVVPCAVVLFLLLRSEERRVG